MTAVTQTLKMDSAVKGHKVPNDPNNLELLLRETELWTKVRRWKERRDVEAKRPQRNFEIHLTAPEKSPQSDVSLIEATRNNNK